ncbi:MAG: enoyl-CoA hydratase/isomerase family protein [Actinobacteria bacterium]|nr:MAG: enoyl-CoA hydratase/isomerase family protein [Actinomycetota bacterium]
MSVDYEVRDRVGYATLNRPEALNALDEATLGELAALLPRVAADPAVKALVFAGAGRAFSVGLDIDLLRKAFDDTSYFRDVLERLKRLLLDVEALPVPVIAAVNGLTRAGGLELALACDFVLIADEARIGDTHLAYGILPGGGASQRLPRAIGRQDARELILTGRWITGSEAAAIGLALRSVPAATLPDTVEEFAGRFRGLSRACLAATKAAMAEGAALPLSSALDLEIDHFIRYLDEEPTAREGFDATIERREPRWP